jgi:type II secretory pathway pseudopilin PulG
MKKIRILLIGILFIIAGTFIQQVNAQEKTKEEQEQEFKIQQAIIEQKKAMAEQKRAQEEALKELQEKSGDVEDIMKDVRVRVESADRYRDVIRMTTPRGSRAFTIDEPFIFTPGGDSYYFHAVGESERTTWDFSRSVKETTFSKSYTFDVEKSTKSVVMSVMGDCNYSDIVIDEFGNLNWRKSFTISETENQDKTGEWKFQVNSSKATGYFKISIQSN